MHSIPIHIEKFINRLMPNIFNRKVRHFWSVVKSLLQTYDRPLNCVMLQSFDRNVISFFVLNCLVILSPSTLTLTPELCSSMHVFFFFPVFFFFLFYHTRFFFVSSCEIMLFYFQKVRIIWIFTIIGLLLLLLLVVYYYILNSEFTYLQSQK